VFRKMQTLNRVLIMMFVYSLHSHRIIEMNKTYTIFISVLSWWDLDCRDAILYSLFPWTLVHYNNACQFEKQVSAVSGTFLNCERLNLLFVRMLNFFSILIVLRHCMGLSIINIQSRNQGGIYWCLHFLKMKWSIKQITISQ